MKRNEQIWWFIIGIILLATLSAAIFQLAGNCPTNDVNLFSAANSASTFSLFTSHGVNNSPNKDDKPPKNNPQPVVMAKMLPISNINLFLILRQIIPLWEKAFIINQPCRTLGFFIPLLAILFFSIFYQTSRTGPGDEDPYHPVL